MNDGRLQNFEVAIAMLRREVNIWDPIGLLDCGAPDDEYECIMGDLFSLLKAGATPDRIADYL